MQSHVRIPEPIPSIAVHASFGLILQNRPCSGKRVAVTVAVAGVVDGAGNAAGYGAGIDGTNPHHEFPFPHAPVRCVAVGICIRTLMLSTVGFVHCLHVWISTVERVEIRAGSRVGTRFVIIPPIPFYPPLNISP